MSPVRVASAAAVAAASAVLAAWLAAHHPTAPLEASLGCVAIGAATFFWPTRWILWLLPLLPMVGWMPWTGWITVEEFDLVVLSVAAGGYLRLVIDGRAGQARAAPADPSTQGHRSSPSGPRRSLAPVLLWLLPLVISTAISLARGIADAGGMSWGWWQGYREPLNSLRLAKPIVEVLLLLPLWQAAARREPQAVASRFSDAMVGLLAAVGLWVLWQRIAFPGLLNFTSDYRAVGPFWEMHVGGAGLDAALSMALPFAVAGLAAAQRPRRWFACAAVLAVGLYAALVTFSRIVYLALPMGIVVWWGLDRLSRQRREVAAEGPAVVTPVTGRRAVLVAALIFTPLAAWSFPHSGYRGLLAQGSATALLFVAGVRARSLSPALWVVGFGLGLVAGIAGALLGWAVPKGAYLAFAGSWLAGALLIWLDGQGGRHGRFTLPALAACASTACAATTVDVVWGGSPASASAATTGALLLAALVAARVSPAAPWPDDWRWQGRVVSLLVAMAAVVGVFGGGAYMEGRMASSEGDSLVRWEHWRRALSLLDADDWLFGKGLGRYWANQSMSGRDEDQTGDYRLLPASADGRAGGIVLTSGRHVLGWGEMFRLSQRIDPPARGPVRLRMRVRSDQAQQVHAEICEKFLLYNASCLVGQALVPPSTGRWRTIDAVLRGGAPTRGDWYAPRPIAFSIALESGAGRLEIRSLSLIDSQGRELLLNGDFGAGLARWFFTSDRYHLPWHAKNLAVHLIFEQGLFGLCAFALALAAALWRLSAGAARDHPLAPVLAGSLCGLLVVGFVDSLLDMPRIAWLGLWLMAVALALPAVRLRRPRRGAVRGP